MNNKIEENIKIGRNETFLNALTPESGEDIRHLSMASIALLGRTGNKTCAALLNGEEINLEDREDLLEFIWCHVAPKDEVIKAFLIYPTNPFILKSSVFNWGLELQSEQLDQYIISILIDKQNIKNSESEVIPEKGYKKK